MSTKREEERNEKIIRGLMKLPPNRRCINCNSLGPQYVCINFWTFVCMTCSGIHREFTHRVKSVSMSKFTSQEVEVLQKGGNQRAREIFLKNWDLQGQRLPNGSDVEKVREFIKNVYVHRKFAGGKNSEKPPRDMQSHQGSSEEEMRRASSYHSFSQSPPYDFQYEERQNRKQGAILSRKPGSDRGLYERKVSSFVYSPGHSSEHAYEDRFANEGTSSRVSDYSVSSGGDPFRSAPQSPNSQKDAGFSSPTVDPLGGIFVDHAVQQEINLYSGAHPSGANILPFPQRTTSGSLGSFDSYSVSLKPADCRSLFPSVSEPDQSVPIHQDKAATVSSFVDSSASVDSNALDLFKQPIGLQSVSSPIDLFQLPPEASISSTDIFRPATDSAAISSVYSSQSCPSSSLNLFNAVSQEPLQANMNERLFEPSASNNEGWATFDLPEHSASSLDKQDFSIAGTESAIGNSALTFNPLSSSSTSMQWPEFPSSLAHGWHEDLHNVQVPSKSLSSQDPRGAGQETGCSTGDALPTLLSNVTTESSSDQDVLLFMAEVQPQIEQKSGNPFDILYDSELEASNAFLDMSSLTAVLPSSQLPSSFVGSIDESWFAPNTPSPCAPDAAQAGLSYMSTQAPGSPLQNVPAYGSVASLGGNPFA